MRVFLVVNFSDCKVALGAVMASSDGPKYAHQTCAIPWCRGEGKLVHIPRNDAGQTVLLSPPFNWTKDEIASKDHFICRQHLKSYKAGRVNGVFALHDPVDDPIITSLLERRSTPQPGYLLRTKQTLDCFLSSLQEQRARNEHLRPVSRGKRRSLDQTIEDDVLSPSKRTSLDVQARLTALQRSKNAISLHRNRARERVEQLESEMESLTAERDALKAELG